MEESTLKEKVMKRIRAATLTKTRDTGKDAAVEMESAVVARGEEDLEIAFARSFTDRGGKFIFCLDEQEFIENLKYISEEQKWSSFLCYENGLGQMLNQSGINLYGAPKGNDILLSSCEQLVASTGCVLFSTEQTGGVLWNPMPGPQLVVAHTAQVTHETREALRLFKQKYQQGWPTGFHLLSPDLRGQRDLFVFLIDDSEGA